MCPSCSNKEVYIWSKAKISLAMLKSKNSSMCSGVIKNLITSLQQAIHLLEKVVKIGGDILFCSSSCLVL